MTPADREQMILKYLSLVRYLASKYRSETFTFTDLDDLFQFGCVGLMKAVDRYDPDRGVKFETYATPRIRGEIVDGLRAADRVPRSVRGAGRLVEKATQELLLELQRHPSLGEIAERAGLAESEVEEARLSQANNFNANSGWGATSETDREDMDSLDGDIAHNGVDTASEMEQVEFRERLAAATCALPELHRQALALYYGERLTLPELGRRMGVGRARATRLYVESTLMLREQMALMA